MLALACDGDLGNFAGVRGPVASVFLGWPGRRRNPGRLPPATDGLGAPAARLGKGAAGTIIVTRLDRSTTTWWRI